MSFYLRFALTIGVLAILLNGTQSAWAEERLVFGSFQNQQNAEKWADRLTKMLGLPMSVLEYVNNNDIFHRVATAPLDTGQQLQVRQRAHRADLAVWRLIMRPDGSVESLVPLEDEMPPPIGGLNFL